MAPVGFLTRGPRPKAKAASCYKVRDLAPDNITVEVMNWAIKMRFIDSASWKRSTNATFPSKKQRHIAQGLIYQHTPSLSQFIQSCFGTDTERVLVNCWSVLSEPYKDLLIQQGTQSMNLPYLVATLKEIQPQLQ